MDIFLSPSIEVPFFYNPNPSYFHLKIAEDVAVHTVFFYFLQKIPKPLMKKYYVNGEVTFEFLYRRLRSTPKIIEKLKMLVQYGFLGEETLELLN